MANKKISQLTSGTLPLTGTEELPIVQGGVTVKATAQDVANLAGGGGLPYLVYTAIVNTTGDGVTPVVTEVQNTIGSISVASNGTGRIKFNSSAAFTINKTIGFSNIDNFQSNNTTIPYMCIVSDSVVELNTIDFTYVNTNLNGVAFVEICVYP